MEQTCNQILLRGELDALPAFSHESHGRRFYTFPLLVERLSGTLDRLCCMAPEELVQALDPFDGPMIELQGQVRSFNNRSGTGRRLVISAYAATLAACEGSPANEVTLRGIVCRRPVFRRTPLGREICDLMLAVNRPYRRTDYLPCILWGRTAQACAGLEPGTQLALTGRLQSRSYIKQLEDGGSEERTAYEISAITAQPLPEPEPALC